MKRILVVDDDVVMIRLYEVQLRRSGYSAYYFQNSEEALGRAKGIDPDLAILDYNMPGLNGADLSHALRDLLGKPQMPTIFVTGEMEEGILARIGQIENARLLAKPFSPRRVITLVEEFFAEDNKVANSTESQP
ncbi:MAG: response regulator [Opitutales bacterium]|nr:response regulator [Opitutales bacterium]